MPLLTTDDYRHLLTEIIRKQMTILGPDITLQKIHNLKVIKVDHTGTVTKIHGDPTETFSRVIQEFLKLSQVIVTKAIEPVILKYTAEKVLTPSSPPVQPLAQTHKFRK